MTHYIQLLCTILAFFGTTFCHVPADVLLLGNWKITLPVDSPSVSGSPDEIKQPSLANYSIDPWFVVQGNAVRFRANCGGATTSGSGYARSELREMTNNGTTLASWSNSVGTHILFVREAFTKLPAVKPHAVGAQIHDASDDIIMIRLESQRLFVEGGGKELGDMDVAYQLGTPFDALVVAYKGRILVYYNNVLKVNYTKSGSGWYFKAGVYTQSNIANGDSADDYGETLIYALSVIHDSTGPVPTTAAVTGTTAKATTAAITTTEATTGHMSTTAKNGGTTAAVEGSTAATTTSPVTHQEPDPDTVSRGTSSATIMTEVVLLLGTWLLL